MQRLDSDGLVGGFTNAFTIIASEFHWSYEGISDLTLRQLRTFVASIQQQQYLRNLVETQRFSWLARTICTFIAAGVHFPEGETNTLMQEAMLISMDADERNDLEDQASKPREPKEPEPGSYEKIAGRFGGGMPLNIPASAFEEEPTEATHQGTFFISGADLREEGEDIV